MKIWSKKTFVLAALAAFTVTAAGCAKENKSKELMEQAFAKQTEMKAYSFAGSAELNLDLPAKEGGANSLTSNLMGMFTKGKLEWSGAAATDPVHMEADLKNSATGLELPVILKDNKLFLHIPLLNKQDEYFSMDMTELAQLSGQSNPMSPDSLKNITKTLADTTKLSISGIDPKWFSTEEGTALKDGSKASLYRLDITEKNRKELSDAIKAKLPEVAELVKASGLLSSEQTESWKKQSGSFELQAPGSIVIRVDETGFIREQTLDLAYVSGGSDGKQYRNAIKFTQTYNDVNQEPKFQKTEPKNARPLGDILKLLMPSAAKK